MQSIRTFALYDKRNSGLFSFQEKRLIFANLDSATLLAQLDTVSVLVEDDPEFAMISGEIEPNVLRVLESGTDAEQSLQDLEISLTIANGLLQNLPAQVNAGEFHILHIKTAIDIVEIDLRKATQINPEISPTYKERFLKLFESFLGIEKALELLRDINQTLAMITPMLSLSDTSGFNPRAVINMARGYLEKLKKLHPTMDIQNIELGISAIEALIED